MTAGNTLEPRAISSEPLREASGYCPCCHGIAHFSVDKKLGYLKQCPNCGTIEYLHRRFLRFDRQSRQWQ